MSETMHGITIAKFETSTKHIAVAASPRQTPLLLVSNELRRRGYIPQVSERQDGIIGFTLYATKAKE